MLENTTSAHTPTTNTPSPFRGLGSAIWSQLFLRVGSSAGLLVSGSYFVDLQARGVPLTSVLIGGVSSLVYLTELLFAPFAGSLSDARGRKGFLLLDPVLEACSVLLLPLGTLITALPPLGLVLILISASRLLEGAGSAVTVPATLGFLSDGTDDHPVRRGRQMSFYELASSGGISLGAVLGPLLWASLHLWAFVVIALLYLLGAGLVLLFVREHKILPDDGSKRRRFSLQRYRAIFSHRKLLLFIPAWIAVNAILGIWITSQITFVLAEHVHVRGQFFVGSLYRQESLLSAYLGGYVLLFSLCVVAWAFVLGRLPRLPVLLFTLLGSAIACLGLVGMNHGGSPLVFLPVIIIGVLLEAGFTPAALAYLADQSRVFAEDCGFVMGWYSVILGVGYLLGNLLGGIFAQIAYFDGLALLTVIFVLIGMASIGSLLLVQWKSQHSSVRTA